MNASGDVLAKHSMGGAINQSNFRMTEGFRITLDQAMETTEHIEALEDLVGDGDRESALELLELRVDLSHIDMASAREQLEALAEVSEKKRRVLGQKIIENEVNAIMTTASEDPKTQRACGKKFATMLKQERIPKGSGSMYFWYFLAVHAEAERELNLLERAVGSLKKEVSFPSNLVTSLEMRLAELRKKH